MKDFVLFGIIAALVIYALKDCGGPSSSEVKTIIKTDTIRTVVKGKPDTVLFEVEKIVYKYLPTTEVEPEEGDSLRTFETVVEDSLINGLITTRSTGEVKSVGFSYKPLFPKYITRVDTFKVEINTTIEEKRLGFYLGAVAGANATKFSFVPSVMLKGKKKYAFTLGYDIINKTYHLGAFTKIK